MEGVLDKFGVSWKNENGQKLIELCTENIRSVGNTLLRRIYINLHE